MSDNQLVREDVEFIVIHCSATKPDDDITAEDIDRMHRKRGWRKGGYHVLIRRDGTVEAGGKFLRKLLEIGAHVEGHNFESFGICMAGGVRDYETWQPEDNYTDDQWSALRSILPLVKAVFPNALLRGHRDFEDVNKACPCFDVQERLG